MSIVAPHFLTGGLKFNRTSAPNKNPMPTPNRFAIGVPAIATLLLFALGTFARAAAPAPGPASPPLAPDDPKRFQQIAEWTLTIKKRVASYDTYREGEGLMLDATDRNGLNTRGEGDVQLETQIMVIPPDKLAQMRKLGLPVPPMPTIWKWVGEGEGTFRRSERFVNRNLVNGRVFEGTERDADGATPVILRLEIDFTKGTYTLLSDGSPGTKMIIVPPKMRTVTSVPIEMKEVNVNPEGDRTESRSLCDVNLTVRDHPLPTLGLELTGVIRKPIKTKNRVIGYEVLSWRVGPKAKIPRLYIEAGNEAYLPEPNSNTEVRIRWTEGKPTQIQFKLGPVSKEPGTCLNSTDTATGPDVEFAPGQAGLKIAGITATTTDPVSGVKLLVHDYGTYAEMRAVATFGSATIVATCEETGTDFVTVPYDENNNHIADVWEYRHESVGLPPAWDEDAYPSQPLLKGDGITLYEEYRGFELKGGAHTRLDPRRMELFVVDPLGLLNVKLFENATNLRVLQFDPGQHQALRVDFNAGLGDRKPKYAVQFSKVAGMADPQGVNQEAYAWGDSDGSVADAPVNVRVFEARILAALTSDLRGRIQAALAEPSGEDAGHFRAVGADAALLRRALQALDDPSKVSDVAARIASWVAVHELSHACDIGHHAPAADAGERTCPIRNPSKEEKLYGLPRELLLQTGSAMPFGISKLCQAPDNCWHKLRLRPN